MLKSALGQPNVRKIGLADLRDVLRKGINDFAAMPTHSMFLIVIYPIVGIILLRLSFGYDVLPVVFPLVAGYALLGPLAAVGLYEMSRRREQGLPPLLGSVEGVQPAARPVYRDARRHPHGDLSRLARRRHDRLPEHLRHLDAGPRFVEFGRLLFTTPAGWTLIIVGCGVGFFFALASFTVGVVSFPMLVDRDVGVATAIQTSIRAVAANPVTMAVWGLIVAAALVIGSLPVLIGLTVVLPVLGHSTWHLYRKLVEW